MWSDSDSWLSDMTPRLCTDWSTLTAEDRTGRTLMSTCCSRCPVPSHMISVLDGLKCSLLADVQLSVSVMQAA